LTPEEKDRKRQILKFIILAVLKRNPDLNYYQGFHDFVTVFYLTLGDNMGFYCSQAASLYFIRDYMRESFDPGLKPVLRLIMILLERVDPDTYEMI
jgi:hypothetical protein